MLVVKSKKVIAISRRNGSTETKSFDFYKILMVLKKNFGEDSIINYCIMRQKYI